MMTLEEVARVARQLRAQQREVPLMLVILAAFVARVFEQ